MSDVEVSGRSHIDDRKRRPIPRVPECAGRRRTPRLAGLNRGLRTQVCIYLHESIKSVQYERNISPFIHPINLTIKNPS